MCCKSRSEESKCGDRLSGSVDVGDKCTGTVKGCTYVFPEHLDDPQKILSLGGAMVAEILIGA